MTCQRILKLFLQCFVIEFSNSGSTIRQHLFLHPCPVGHLGLKSQRYAWAMTFSIGPRTSLLFSMMLSPTRLSTVASVCGRSFHSVLFIQTLCRHEARTSEGYSCIVPACLLLQTNATTWKAIPGDQGQYMHDGAGLCARI